MMGINICSVKTDNINHFVKYTASSCFNSESMIYLYNIISNWGDNRGKVIQFRLKALELHPNGTNDFAMNYYLANSYNANKNYIKAIEYYKKSIEVYNPTEKYNEKHYKNAVDFLEKFE